MIIINSERSQRLMAKLVWKVQKLKCSLPEEKSVKVSYPLLCFDGLKRMMLLDKWFMNEREKQYLKWTLGSNLENWE